MREAPTQPRDRTVGPARWAAVRASKLIPSRRPHKRSIRSAIADQFPSFLPYAGERRGPAMVRFV